MESVGAECTELKREYDACFISWFSDKFLKGDKDDSVCAPLLEVYKKCVQNALKEKNINVDEVNIRVLGTDDENRIPPGKSSP
ncbi:unnamed protein product [Notodromas monacha]|uniref:TP53-regulated inhibitor of apoptosis 1 n=1 Tax=Notodromas monacha TaxID=399045 RepID=A0A7R9G8C2_9CRUS|nr:unnamed protein product [Notodromas monacha]CAG0913000.1 unnamed protein product [Notodromas monacha]